MILYFKCMKIYQPATYHITVEGYLDDIWSDRLGGMRITTRSHGDQDVMTTLVGRVRDQGDLETAKMISFQENMAAEAAYRLCPNSLMFLDVIGWLMSLAGEWECGINNIEKAITSNPYYRPWVRHALILNWLRLENDEKAYRETLKLTMPDFFWDQILKATACSHMGNIEAGQECVRDLLALKPDFSRRVRILIGRYVKFDDIADRIIEGLGKLGMKIA